MKKIVFTSLVFALIACSSKQTSNQDFIDKVIDLTIESASGDFVEFPGLYKNLADHLPDDQNEKLILVAKLKERGFEVTNWGRGNLPPLGPRVIEIELTKEDCICTVSKMYFSTTADSLFQRVEGISCERKHGK